MSIRRITVIACSTLSIFILILLRRKRYPEISVKKLILISAALAISGVAGSMLMNYIESGSFLGTSFFGAILFVPVFMLPLTKMDIPFGKLMDICAPAGCAIVAVLKWDCVYAGCCSGKTFTLWNWTFKVPIQIMESLASLVIMFLLLHYEKSQNRKNQIYPIYLIIYGIVRFSLNWLRTGLEPFVWILPPGNFWSLVAILFGCIWLRLISPPSKNCN